MNYNELIVLLSHITTIILSTNHSFPPNSLVFPICSTHCTRSSFTLQRQVKLERMRRVKSAFSASIFPMSNNHSVVLSPTTTTLLYNRLKTPCPNNRTGHNSEAKKNKNKYVRRTHRRGGKFVRAKAT